MVTISFCRLGRILPESFAGYVLPYVRRDLARAKTDSAYTVIGAIWNGLACGAAVVEWSAYEGNVRSFFIDPKARARGIASHMLDLLLEEGARLGKDALYLEYILKDEELAAMDALVLSHGGTIETDSPVCGMKSEDFLDSPLVGPALRPGFQRPAPVALFADLAPSQIEVLESGTGLPSFLRPSYLGDRVDPNLSAAWVVDGKPVAFVAGFQTGDRVFCMSSIWRGPDAPPSSFRSLILTQINQCWYRSGGSFSFFISPITPRVEAIAEWFTGGNYDPYTHRDAEIPIPSES